MTVSSGESTLFTIVRQRNLGVLATRIQYEGYTQQCCTRCSAQGRSGHAPPLGITYM